MLVSRRNKEYKKQCMSAVGISGLGIIFLNGILGYCAKDGMLCSTISQIIFISSSIILLNLLMLYFLIYYYFEAINEYVFNDGKLIIKNKHGVKK